MVKEETTNLIGEFESAEMRSIDLEDKF